MLRVKAFRALRPPPNQAATVASVPYDVCSREEALAMAQGRPNSFLHVVRPDIDLPEGTDPYADDVYESARQSLERLVAEGSLVRDEDDCVFVYRQQMLFEGTMLQQTGVVACCHVDDYRNNVIKKHELTRKKKEDDRTRHVLTLNAHTGPVFILHREHAELNRRVEAIAQETPLYDFTAADDVRHTIWRVPNAADLIAQYQDLGEAYVADGHHRSASASRAAEEKAASAAGRDIEANWFLSVLFPASQLHVLPYNRHVIDLNGLSYDEFVQRLSLVADVQVTKGPQRDSEPGAFGFYVGGLWHAATWRDPVSTEDPVASLDYVILYERVLAPILGIGEVRTDPRVDFIGGIRGPGALSQRVDNVGGVAFLMPAVTVEQLMAVSDAGSIMPPKSTWFEPKLRSGLLVHTLD